jgi:hypothetical protein
MGSQARSGTEGAAAGEDQGTERGEEAVSSVDTAVPQHCFGRADTCTEAPAYIWTGSHGGKYWLCVRCCAEWREQVRGTFIEPERIRSTHTEDRA